MSGPPRDEPTNIVAARLIAENKHPDLRQEERIREAISRLQADVRKIQTEFNELDIALAIIPPDETPEAHLVEQLSQLVLQLSEAKDILADHVNCLARGRQIPVELMEIIFSMTMPPTDYVRPNALRAPLLLCQVCSSWRKVALVTARLWNSLHINPGRRRGTWKGFLESWLGRSGTGPLSLRFEGHQPELGPQPQLYTYFQDHILKIIVEDYSKRWRRLSLDVSAWSLTRLVYTSMPLLETLEVRVPRGSSGVFISSADAPRLRTVSLGAHTIPASVHVAWERLTHLHAASPLDLDQVFPLLAKCEKLTECSIELWRNNHIRSSQSLLPVRMIRLRSLVLSGSIGEDAISVFFENMDLPGLRKLELVNTMREPFGLSPQSPLASLARRSNLRILVLIGGKPLDGLFDTVVSIPSLREEVN
ncbi:hypothetical protein DFH07DRAFT_768181 [Mycena maculata]|uniref:F-box domain-containing protein n=1 Tax=Mycena maculata TaxID=230809 RepID=A0AAD7JUI5_9AGAR|nr:hypothetical protein DFH07DRAFT_768181 [Mycena maculata]